MYCYHVNQFKTFNKFLYLAVLGLVVTLGIFSCSMLDLVP